MSKKALITIAVILTALAGCKKTDDASKWAGTYIECGCGLYPNTFYRLIVREKDRNTLSIEADTTTGPSSAPYITYVTLQNVALQGATTASFSEYDTIAGNSHLFQFSGTATLNGSSITLQGTGVNSNDTLHFYFFGLL
jgi:hypothetical protein